MGPQVPSTNGAVGFLVHNHLLRFRGTVVIFGRNLHHASIKRLHLFVPKPLPITLLPQPNPNLYPNSGLHLDFCNIETSEQRAVPHQKSLSLRNIATIVRGWGHNQMLRKIALEHIYFLCKYKDQSWIERPAK